MTSPTSIDPADLPATIRRYLVAHADRDSDAALQTFSPDAVVVDQDRTFRGTGEVLDFLQNVAVEFNYTTELVGAERVDDQQWVAHNHLEGDFPGGVVDLTYRFTLSGDRITELVIAG